MTLSSAIERRSVRVSYVVGAALLIGVTMLLGQLGIIPGWVSFALFVFCLGPLGLATVFVLFIPVIFTLMPIYPVAALLAAVIAAGVAWINVVAISRWVRPPKNGYTRVGPNGVTVEVTPTQWHRIRVDQVLGGMAFALAGLIFIALCFISGYRAATSHGLASQFTDAHAARTVLLASIAWWTGLALAVAGLVLWIVRARRRQHLLLWAIIEDVLLVALIVLTISG